MYRPVVPWVHLPLQRATDTHKASYERKCTTFGVTDSVSTVLVQDHFYSDYTLQDNILNSHLHP